MEYAEGETLAELLTRRGILAEDELKALLFPILDGLAEVHRVGYLHRDVKPSNIILREDGSPVILDFGSARQALSARSRSVTSLVTPGYAPIEQYSSRGNQGPWTDIYATAAVAYRALTGLSPKPAPERVFDDPFQGWRSLVPSATSRFLNAIDQALAFKEEERPQSVAEWREALDPDAAWSTRAHVSSKTLMRDERASRRGSTGIRVQRDCAAWHAHMRFIRTLWGRCKRLVPPWTAVAILATTVAGIAIWLPLRNVADTPRSGQPVVAGSERDRPDATQGEPEVGGYRSDHALVTPVQRELRRLGFTDVAVDGVADRKTLDAIHGFATDTAWHSVERSLLLFWLRSSVRTSRPR